MKRCLQIICVITLGALIALCAELEPTHSEAPQLRKTLVCWYTDDALTDYLNSAAVSYTLQHSDIRVVPVQVPAGEYLEYINDASVGRSDVAPPDLYVLTSEDLEKAYLAGLAVPVQSLASGTGLYPDTALSAVTYRGQCIAYPLSFETTALIYNKALCSEAQLPRTIPELLAFGDSFDAPEGVETVLTWDVSDLFADYQFIGACIDAGGPAGDDAGCWDIYNPQAVECLAQYQSLANFFSIDDATVSTESVEQDFLASRTVFTIAGPDFIPQIEAAVADGSFPYSYGVAAFPAPSGEIASRPLSITTCIAINGYSEDIDAADDFARYCCEDQADTLYYYSGKLAAYKSAVPQVDTLQAYADIYARSASLPKLMSAGDFWIQLEIVFSEVWNGQDPDALLRELQDS